MEQSLSFIDDDLFSNCDKEVLTRHFENHDI
jgi:hypothetical protein